MSTAIYPQELIEQKVARIYEDFQKPDLVVYDCRNCEINEMIKKTPAYQGLIVLWDENNGKPRIVFVGYSNCIRKRVRQYFQDSERNATLKRHIGDAFLNKDGFDKKTLDFWWDYQNEHNDVNYEIIEKKYIKIVRDYIKNNLSFVTVQIKNAGMHEKIAKKILATLSHCEYFVNDDWLGNYSTHREVRESGLWAMRTFRSKDIMEDDDFEYLEKCLRGEE